MQGRRQELEKKEKCSSKASLSAAAEVEQQINTYNVYASERGTFHFSEKEKPQ